MRCGLYFEVALSTLQDGQKLTGKDGILKPLIKQLTEAALEAEINDSAVNALADPAQWLPINETYRCEYVAAWAAVKHRWELAMDAEEKAVIYDLQSQCND
jgi:hypothetical protein